MGAPSRCVEAFPAPTPVPRIRARPALRRRQTPGDLRRPRHSRRVPQSAGLCPGRQCGHGARSRRTTLDAGRLTDRGAAGIDRLVAGSAVVGEEGRGPCTPPGRGSSPTICSTLRAGARRADPTTSAIRKPRPAKHTTMQLMASQTVPVTSPRTSRTNATSVAPSANASTMYAFTLSSRSARVAGGYPPAFCCSAG